MKSKDLKTLSDDELRKKRDEIAEHTMVGLNYFQEEIDRRDRIKGDLRNFWLSIASLIVAIIALVVAIAK